MATRSRRKGPHVYEVAIVFTDGSKVEFHATQFDIDLDPNNLPGSGATSYTRVQKFTYKDAEGEDAPLYLKLDEVAGIVVARTQRSNANFGLKTR